MRLARTITTLLAFIIVFVSSVFSQSRWTGTGFALNEGYVVTNYHVVEGATSIFVIGTDPANFSKKVEAEVIATDKFNDLAIIRLRGVRPVGVPYSIKSSMAEVGENVWVLGYPMTQTMGEEIKLTTGVVSSRSGFDGDKSLYQISAPIQPGNSGGPLFDDNGNVIGVICAHHTGAELVSYAIKASYLRNLMECEIDHNIFPANYIMSGKKLSEKVKLAKKYVYYILCSSSKTSGGVLNSTAPRKPSNIQQSPKQNRMAVDLGLSVKWATFNVGATKPEECGKFFAWGEVKTKYNYSDTTYKYSYGKISSRDFTLTKYNRKSSNKNVDNEVILEPSDDAATFNWGGSWRMPTIYEFKELQSKCTWIWTTLNGVKGYKVIGSNGNSIFLPITGDYRGKTHYTQHEDGSYWSSSFDPVENMDSPYMLLFGEGEIYTYFTQFLFWGNCVRPVCP